MAKRRGHGEGSIFWNSARQRWQASITLDDGRRKTVTAKTREEAGRKLNAMLHAQSQGTLATGKNQNLGAWLRDWLEGKRDNLKPGSIVQYEGAIENHLIPGLGKIMLQKLTAQHIERFYRTTMRESADLEESGAHLVKELHKVLRQALDKAVRYRLVAFNAADAVELPTYKQQTPQRALTVAEAERLLQAAREIEAEEVEKTHGGYETWLETFILLGLTTGLRRGEMLALHWSDIDLEQGTITVTKTLEVRGGRMIEQEPKTSSSIRIVALGESTRAALARHKALPAANGNPKGLVFHRNGGHFHPSSVRAPFQGAVKRAGIGACRIHDLRHSAATILHSKGVDLTIIQRMLGHSTYRVTADIYTHIDIAEQKKAMEKWGEFGTGEG